MNLFSMTIVRAVAMVVLVTLLAPLSMWAQEPVIERVPAIISGGHDTDPRDHGRPVVLIAAGLGVTPNVFREAFARVHPVTPGNSPDQTRAQRNKALLLGALSQYGISNEALDTVSDYYRYQPGLGLLWPTNPAVVIARVRNGAVIGYEVIKHGSGYSSPPTLSVSGARSAPVTVNLFFSKDLTRNGSILSVELR